MNNIVLQAIKGAEVKQRVRNLLSHVPLEDRRILLTDCLVDVGREQKTEDRSLLVRVVIAVLIILGLSLILRGLRKT